jgi:hypothetical protein
VGLVREVEDNVVEGNLGGIALQREGAMAP